MFIIIALNIIIIKLIMISVKDLTAAAVLTGTRFLFTIKLLEGVANHICGITVVNTETQVSRL